MFTTDNYFSKVTPELVASLPDTLKKTHNIAKEGDKPYFRENDEVKEFLELHVNKVNEHLSSPKKQGTVELKKTVAKSPKPKKSPPQKQPLTSKPKSQSVKRKKSAEVPKKENQELETKFLFHQRKDLYFIKRYLNLHNKQKTKHQIGLFIKALQRSIVGKEIRKTSEYANQINHIQEKLCDNYNKMDNGDILPITLKEDTLSQLKNILKQEQVYKSVMLFKRFIGLQGKGDPIKISNLLKSVQNAIAKKVIATSDPYFEQIQSMVKRLESALDSGEVLRAEKAELANLNGIIASVGQNDNLDGFNLEYVHALDVLKPSRSILRTMDEIDSVIPDNSFRLKGDLGRLLGDLEQFELAITIESDQGGGKTNLSYQMANALADIGKKTAIFSLEIGDRSDLIRRMRDRNIKPENWNSIKITGQLPNGLQTIRELAKQYDVIVIDSWNKLNAPSSEFDRLRKDFPHTIFIVIFQRTSQGIIRGGTAPLFDAGINLEIEKVDDTFVNNYAVATKNRYGQTGIKYNIHSQKII